MNKLNELISLCKGSVTIEINNHKDIYLSVVDYLIDNSHQFETELTKYVGEKILNKMIELNTIVEIQIYPNNSVSFYKIFHYDLDLALDEALKCIKE